MPGRLTFRTTADGAASTTERMRINSNGNVRIGGSSDTTDEGYRLTLQGSANATYFQLFDSTTGTTHGSDGTLLGLISGDAYLYNREAKSMIFGTSNNERMRIASDGKVNIGTTTNTVSKAFINGGSLSVNGADGNFSAGGNRAMIDIDSTNVRIGAIGGGTSWTRGLAFQVCDSTDSSSECARFSFRGALCIGTTTQEEPGNTNTTTGNVFKKDGRFFHSMDGTWGLMNRNDSDGTLCVFAREGTHVGNISVNSSATSYNTGSDYRLKENITAISDGITRLKTLKPSRFNFKVNKDKRVDGFIAHEVTAVPEAITGEKDGSEMQQIDQSKLVPLLTAALQEAITKIETLETKVAALEAK